MTETLSAEQRAHIGGGARRWVVVASIGALLAAWVMANPPGAAPDEPAQYTKTVGLAYGEWLGRPIPAGQVPAWEQEAWFQRLKPHVKEIRRDWFRRISRIVTIPARMEPPIGFGCNAFHPERSAGECPLAAGAPTGEATTYVGVRQPFAFLVSAPLVRAAESPAVGLRLARAGMAALALLLLGLGVFLAWDPRAPAVSLLGLALAVSPMVVFIASSVSNSGPEIAAAIALFASVARLARGEPPSRAVWAALGLGSVVLATVRPVGPVFLAIVVGIGVVFLGWRRARALLASHRRAFVAVGAAAAAAAAANLFWQFRYQPHGSVEQSGFREFAREAFGDLGGMAREWVGVFGWTDTPLPSWVMWLWLAAAIALIVAALRAGMTRHRVAIVGLGAGTVFAAVVITAAFAEPLGVGLQGRWVLPLIVGVPVLSGEVVRARYGDALEKAALTGIAIAGGLHVVAFWVNAWRHATGVDGSWWFFGAAEWSPPWGWWPWLALATSGAAGLVLAARSGSVRRLGYSSAPNPMEPSAHV